MPVKKHAKRLKQGKRLEPTKPLTKISDFHIIKTVDTPTPTL
jgi:hypothetical protein